MGFRNIAILSVFVVITAQMATADICDDKCKYGGTCTPTQQGSSFHCDCTPGRCGNKCNQEFSSCKGKRKDCCQNGGTCVDGDTPSCVCTTGWTGAFCELIDYCASNPCLNEATCNNGLEGYTCTCATGSMGVNCETKCAYGETGQTAPAPPCNSKCCVRRQAYSHNTPPKYFLTAKPGNVETVHTCDNKFCAILLDVENCNAMETADDANSDVTYSIRDDWNAGADNVNKLVFWSASQYHWMEVKILPGYGGDLIDINPPVYGYYSDVSLCVTGYNGGPLQVTDFVTTPL